MSRKHDSCKCSEGLEMGGRKPTLPGLIILILILLQFTRGGWGNTGGLGGFEGIDNGILFIIALFYLSCCNPCKSSSETY